MKNGLNKVLLIGNLGADPDLRYMPNGQPVCQINIATNEEWKDQQGNVQKKTEWHTVVAYRQLAEIMGKYLKTGSTVHIEGKLQTRKWQDQNGNDRYTTEVIAKEMIMLDSRPQSQTAQTAPRTPQTGQSYQQMPSAQQPQQPQGEPDFDLPDGDVPF